MSTPKTPNINLNLPVPGPTGTPGPAWAEELNQNFEIIDEAIHALGSSTSRASTFDVDADINMDSHKLTALMGMVLESLTTALANPASIYVKNGDLYYKDSSFNEIRLTAAGQLDAKGIFGQYQSSDAFANYVAADGTYEFWDNALKTSASSIRAGDIILAKKGSNGAIAVRLKMNGGTATGFTLTLPAALPGVNSVVSVDNTGAMTFSNTLTGLTMSLSDFVSGTIRGNTTIGGNSLDVINIGGGAGVVNFKGTIQDSFIGQSEILQSEIQNSNIKGITNIKDTVNIGTNNGDYITIGRADGLSTIIARKPQITDPLVSGGSITSTTVNTSTINNSDVNNADIDNAEITNSIITGSEMNSGTIEGIPTATIAALVGSAVNPNNQVNSIYNFDQMDRLSPTQSTDSSGKIQRTFWPGLSYQLAGGVPALNSPMLLSTKLSGGVTFGRASLYSNIPSDWVSSGASMIQTLEVKFKLISVTTTDAVTIGFFSGQGLFDASNPYGIGVNLVRYVGEDVVGSMGIPQFQVKNTATGAWVNTGESSVDMRIKIEIKNGDLISYTFYYSGGGSQTFGDYSFNGSNGRQYAGSAFIQIDQGTASPVNDSSTFIHYLEHKTTNVAGR